MRLPRVARGPVARRASEAGAQPLDRRRLRLVLRALDELFPHAGRGLAQDQVRVRIVYVLETALDLRPQLSGFPQDQAGVEPRLLGPGLDDAVHLIALDHDVEIGQELDRAACRA